jgi:RNA polymerase sigma-70 factor (ECF subfamily)
MGASPPDTNELLRAAEHGDGTARQHLLARHRSRLRQMVAVHLDRRLAARIDPSDVVQETFIDAALNLSDYLRERPLPFYPWLRQLAWQRLERLHRDHIQRHRRSVLREEGQSLLLPDPSADALANVLKASGTSPSRHLIRNEMGRRVQEALNQLSPNDRELLVMRHLEEMSAAEIGAVLGIGAGAVRTRHVRALARLRSLLDDDRSKEWR